MNPVSIRRAWIEAFPNSAPAGFICRTAAAERWLRTHSLSNSKRYPDSEQELAEVLLRYNTVATQVIGQDASCVLFIARFGNERQWRNDEEGPLSGFELLHVMSHGEGDASVQFFATSVTWRAGEFDSLLSAVADDKTGPVLFFNPSRFTAFAPYDGGADLFVESAAEADRLKSRFADWLSTRTDGL